MCVLFTGLRSSAGDSFSICCQKIALTEEKKKKKTRVFLLSFPLIPHCFVANSAEWFGRGIFCRLWQRERNLDRIVIWHVGVKKRRAGGGRGARAFYCQTHTSMSLLQCMCSVKNAPSPLVDSLVQDNKHQNRAKCTWLEYIKTYSEYFKTGSFAVVTWQQRWK